MPSASEQGGWLAETGRPAEVKLCANCRGWLALTLRGLEAVFMIESFMCFGIGFFLAALSVLVVAFLVHGRAVRLTMRRFEHHPAVDVEVHADKDRMRAEFAMSTRVNTATENPEAEKATLQAGTPVGERGRSACRNWPRAPGGADHSSPLRRSTSTSI
jgi:hypothetical protein